MFDAQPVGPTVAAWSFRSGRPLGAIAGGGHWPRLTPANAISCQHAGAWTQVQAEGGNVSTTSAWNSPSRPPRESPDAHSRSSKRSTRSTGRCTSTTVTMSFYVLRVNMSSRSVARKSGQGQVTWSSAPRECPMHTGAWSRTLVTSLKCSRQPASRPFSETLAGTNRNG